MTSGLLFSGYTVYEYIESSAFCGTLCHTMFSQYARYQSSAHVNVACADCHIGPGAGHFVSSKIEGVWELIAQVTHTYQRPIKSPVENLRPARETCETCHTPTSFRDNVVKTLSHFENDPAKRRKRAVSGLINGALAPNANAYKFMLWAGDGSPDTFRIRIWWEDAAGEHDVYHNGTDQAIGGGNIVVHAGK